jgi:two-component sensor histidine kinase
MAQVMKVAKVVANNVLVFMWRMDGRFWFLLWVGGSILNRSGKSHPPGEIAQYLHLTVARHKTLYFRAKPCLVVRALFRRLLIPLFLGMRLAAAEPVLDTVAKIHALTPEVAARGMPARIEGIATYYDPQKFDLFVQDSTGGIYVGAGDAQKQALKIRAGDRLVIQGKSSRTGFSTDITLESIQRLEHGPLPEPLHPGEDELLSPTIDCQWVEVPAVVVGVESRETAEVGGIPFTLSLNVHGWKMEAIIPHDEHAEQRAAALAQRPVRMRCVAGTIFNSHGQMTGRYFFVPSFDQILPIDTNASAAPAPLRKVADLLQSNDTSYTLVRLEGVVTQQAPNGFYLRDPSGDTLVLTAQNEPFLPGTRVAAEGFAAIAPYRPLLRARHVAILGTEAKPEPIRFESWNKIAKSEFKTELYDYQSALITLEADFLAVQEGPGESVLQCHNGNYYFTALLPGPPPKNLAPGDHVRLTGICEFWTTRPVSYSWLVDGFRLHLPKDGGVVVLHHAPWWTLKHMIILFAGIFSVVVLVALGTFIWVWVLRRQVKVQTGIIGDQLQKVAVQGERQRIARELHDTVEQELASISMQLDNISTYIKQAAIPLPARLPHFIDIVQKMLHHCRSEARSSIQELRNIELEQRGLGGALHALLPQISDGGGADLQLQVTGEPRPLARIVETHLLRIAQEGVANAARHAAARKINVELDYTPAAVTLVIRDDGCGLDPAVPVPHGHFGLRGIRERANKLEATLDIEGAPGKGTTIRVVVPTPP